MAGQRRWTFEEVVLAVGLYCELPFGQFHRRNPEVLAMAQRLDRTPSSVAMKLCNLASLDPGHQRRGVSGLTNASALDREVWELFHGDWGVAFERLDRGRHPDETERRVERVERRGQEFFRRAVLTAYGGRCCVTGIEIPSLLVAGHISPWSQDAINRLNPRNGLCMAWTQERAFDKGLWTLDEDLRVMISPELSARRGSEGLEDNFLKYEGRAITLPDRFEPDPTLLAWHRERCFVR